MCKGAITPAITVVLLPVAHVQLVSIFGLHNLTLIHPLMLPRLLLLLPFALLAATASAQITAIDSSAQCIAYWSKGDKMTYSVISTKLKLKDADTTMAEQGSYMVDITVLDSTAKSYTIQWAYRDYNLGSDNPVVQKLADMYRDMTIKVKTDEMGAITEVINWKELRDETNRFYKALMKDMKELNELPGFKAMMDRTMKTFSTKEAIESLAVADIQQFHSFFGAAYTLNDELKGRMKVPNFLGGRALRLRYHRGHGRAQRGRWQLRAPHDRAGGQRPAHQGHVGLCAGHGQEHGRRYAQGRRPRLSRTSGGIGHPHARIRMAAL
jgi:hypothetical protein